VDQLLSILAKRISFCSFIAMRVSMIAGHALIMHIVCVLGTLFGVLNAAGFVTIGDAGFVGCWCF
jgi:hypothetical protein